MIILGKTNMTVRQAKHFADKGLQPTVANMGHEQEFAGMKMTMMMPGWSAYGGQTLSPYVGKIEEGETILGHSVSSRYFPTQRRSTFIHRLLYHEPHL